VKTSLALQYLAPGHADRMVARPVPLTDPRPDEIQGGGRRRQSHRCPPRRWLWPAAAVLDEGVRVSIGSRQRFFRTVTAVGTKVTDLKAGDKVFGVKAASSQGTHASRVLVKANFAALAPPGRDLGALAALPYSFVTIG
jgi:hypothetical protein